MITTKIGYLGQPPFYLGFRLCGRALSYNDFVERTSVIRDTLSLMVLQKEAFDKTDRSPDTMVSLPDWGPGFA